METAYIFIVGVVIIALGVHFVIKKGLLGALLSDARVSIRTAKELKEAREFSKEGLARVILVDGIFWKETVGKVEQDKLTLPAEQRTFFIDDATTYRDENKTLTFVLSNNNHHTLNLTKLDNENSFDFSCDAFNIMKTKAFEFLEPVSSRTIMFVALIFIALGMFLGSIIQSWV